MSKQDPEMQRIKRNWFRATALKKLVVITGICFMLFMAFFSAYHVFATSSLNFYGGAGYNQGTGVSCSATGGSGDAGSFCSVSFQTAGAVGTGNTVVGFSGGGFPLYVTSSSFVQVSGPSPTIVSNGISTYGTTGWSSASTRTATLAAHNGDLLLAIATGAGASSFGTAFISGDSQSLVWTPTSGSTSGGCIGGPPCTPVLAQVYFWFTYATATGSESVTMSSTTTNGMAGGLVVYDISGSTSVGGGNGCNVYACQTSTYAVTWTNATCVAGSSGTCTKTTTYSIVNFDATSTNITNIIYCDSQIGCAHFSQTQNITVTYTDTSVKQVNTTKTTTVTNTALNAPSGFTLQFWLVPLIFLMGPAFGFMGAYGSVTRERGGNVASNTALLFFLLGLNLGAIGGIILKVMPFPVLVLTFIPLVLLLYSMR